MKTFSEFTAELDEACKAKKKKQMTEESENEECETKE